MDVVVLVLVLVPVLVLVLVLVLLLRGFAVDDKNLHMRAVQVLVCSCRCAALTKRCGGMCVYVSTILKFMKSKFPNGKSIINIQQLPVLHQPGSVECGPLTLFNIHFIMLWIKSQKPSSFSVQMLQEACEILQTVTAAAGTAQGRRMAIDACGYVYEKQVVNARYEKGIPRTHN